MIEGVEVELTPAMTRTLDAVVDGAFGVLRRLIEVTGVLELVATVSRPIGASWAKVHPNTWSRWMPVLSELGLIHYQEGTYCSVTVLGFPGLALLVDETQAKASLTRRHERGFGDGEAVCRERARGGLWWQPVVETLRWLLDGGPLAEAQKQLEEFVANHERERALAALTKTEAVVISQLQQLDVPDEEKLQKQLARTKRERASLEAIFAADPVWSRRGERVRALMLNEKETKIERLTARLASGVSATAGVAADLIGLVRRGFTRERAAIFGPQIHGDDALPSSLADALVDASRCHTKHHRNDPLASETDEREISVERVESVPATPAERKLWAPTAHLVEPSPTPQPQSNFQHPQQKKLDRGPSGGGVAAASRKGAARAPVAPEEARSLIEAALDPAKAFFELFAAK